MFGRIHGSFGPDKQTGYPYLINCLIFFFNKTEALQAMFNISSEEIQNTATEAQQARM